jgi:hypothetical protein
VQQKNRHGGRPPPDEPRRNVGKRRQGRQSQHPEEEAGAHDHVALQHRLQVPRQDTLALEDKPDVVSAVAIQPEAEPAVALDEGCVAVGEGEAPNESHDGPCAIEGARYNNDTQFDTWKIFLHTSTLISNAIDSANNRSMLVNACLFSTGRPLTR